MNFKADLRRQMRAKLTAISADLRTTASAAACERLRSQALWQQARSILFYAALPGELDLSPLIREALKAGKVAALPRFSVATGVYEIYQIADLDRDCAPGKYGIAEPGAQCQAASLKLDLALAPGLGFDLTGHRLGRGQGYYDRLLAGLKSARCGVAFDEQILERLPAEAHDIRMNFILTPTRWLRVPE